MVKDFKALSYIVDENLADTLHWLSEHQDCFDALHYDVAREELSVEHANGIDIIRVGHYLNATYGILLTS
ncbi:hypothetical protein RFH42_05480 [Acinetobacter rudis]|uniref:hypothetical protein n=1 Tax=Acinetobacter rudis TaxID=632955 RepID=UPI00280D8E90|nr:hypothetical protein [Acinetobacter rudis]MDQ8952413.1 hypothetical protein [Acinetobacter rudis]